jgi:putative toxin-antitoxin system antitoxin component (TIGR02293 family)
MRAAARDFHHPLDGEHIGWPRAAAARPCADDTVLRAGEQQLDPRCTARESTGAFVISVACEFRRRHLAIWRYTFCHMADIAVDPRQVADLLGGEEVVPGLGDGPDQIVQILRRGLPHQSLDAYLAAMDLQRGVLYKVLDVAARTAARRKGAMLRPDESDRLYRIARISALAVQVLGSRRKAAAWLREPNYALGGHEPMSLLDTEVGSRQVESALGRIAYGVFG